MPLRPILFALALALASQAAAAKEQPWIEVRSPHFTVISNASPKEARKAAENFEQIRAVFEKAFPRSRVDPNQPVVILAVKREKDLKALLPAYWEVKGHTHPVGLFVPRLDVNYVALELDLSGDYAYHPLYHEYVHLLERLNFTSLPLWLSEGMADFYGYSTIGSKHVEIGNVDPDMLTFLQSARRIPLDVLFAVDYTSPFYNEQNPANIFYAESWELTHYLYLGDRGAHRSMMLDYLDLLSRHDTSLEAARLAFGDFKRLSAQLEDYSSRNVYEHYVVPAPFRAAEADFAIRALAPAEAAAIRGDFYVHTQRPVEARASLDEAMRLDPRLAAPYTSLGILALEQRNHAQALASFSRAAQLDPSSYVARYYRAQLSLTGVVSSNALSAAENDLREVIRLKPDFSPAYRLLARLDSIRGEHLDDARSLAEKAIQLEPGNLENLVALGYVLARMDKTKDAEALATRILATASSAYDRAQAQVLLEAARRRETMLAERSALAASHPLERPAEPRPAPGVPSFARANRNQPAPASSQPAPASSATAPPPPDFGATTWGEGRAVEVACSGKTLVLKLVFEGYPLRLRSDAAASISYSVGQRQPLAGFHPCPGLKGKYLKVEYRVAVGKSYDGDILKIEIQP